MVKVCRPGKPWRFEDGGGLDVEKALSSGDFDALQMSALTSFSADEDDQTGEVFEVEYVFRVVHRK